MMFGRFNLEGRRCDDGSTYKTNGLIFDTQNLNLRIKIVEEDPLEIEEVERARRTDMTNHEVHNSVLSTLLHFFSTKAFREAF